MGQGFWASQPTSVDPGTVDGASYAAITVGLIGFSVSTQADIFSAASSNLKYALDGGILSHSQTAEMSLYDLRSLHASQKLSAGSHWVGTAVVFPCEGSSNGSYGTLTTTIADMYITSSAFADQGGRQALNIGFQVFSVNGSTAPITYAIS